jgi:hypothetical protein
MTSVRISAISSFSSSQFFRRAAVVMIVGLSFFTHLASAQQTLGSLNGMVTDSSGAVVANASVKARAVATNLSVNATSKSDGSFSIADLPIGTYEVTFTKDGFQKAVYPEIIVRGDRTATVNASLKPGSATESVTVEATPLLNETDTTTGYTLTESQITETPLGTGSFTQLAILSPGVSADLLNTAGTNAGLGNQAIWANGQRDTSNSFTMNGVNTTNLFSGKSTSQVTSARVAVNIGENGNGNNPSGEIATSTSVYGAIGQALPSPPPETIQEIQVNSAMYDASQGANSGAQIVTITKSGTNQLHGGSTLTISRPDGTQMNGSSIITSYLARRCTGPLRAAMWVVQSGKTNCSFLGRTRRSALQINCWQIQSQPCHRD